MSEDSMKLQDEAAGGALMRELVLEDGSVVRAAISVRQFVRSKCQRYAYLQFKHSGKTVTKYVGKVTSESKEDSVRSGWTLLINSDLVESLGWKWVHRKSTSDID